MPALARQPAAELLDALNADDPRARRARLELRLVNRLMGNAMLLERALRGRIAHHATLLDLGAGDGAMALRLAKRLHRRARHVHLVLLDRQPCVAPSTRAAFEQLGWHVEVVPADAARWLASTPRRFSAIVANLFLHHFDDAALTSLLEAAAARTELLVACEPRRSRFALWGSRLLGALGAGAITRHDAPASVRAGFARRELSAAWPDAPGWRLGERAAGLFSHVFVAERRSV